jgi:tRNA dimethylallyltransferase
LIAVMGSTASGKTALAEALADELGARLINADNFQCYRYLDIGTAKPDDRSRYDLLDILNPDEPFGVGEWVQRATGVLERREFETYVVVGGSGLNVRALFEGYSGMKGPPPEELRESLNQRRLDDLVGELKERDPEAAANVDLKNPVRVKRALERLETPSTPVRAIEGFEKLKIGLEVSPEWVNPRVSKRVEDMIEAGWMEEVAGILDKGYRYDDPGIKAHGYRNLWDVLEGRKDLETAKDEIAAMVRQYAKRQRTWMRTEPNLCKISAEDGRRAVSHAIGLVKGGLTIGEIH